MRASLLGLLLIGFAAPASAQLLRPHCPPTPACPPGSYLTPPLPGVQDPMNPANPPMLGQNDPLANAFAQGNESGGTAPRAFNDNFNGDFGGISCTCLAAISAGTAGNLNQGIAATPGTTRIVRLPAGSRYNGILNTDNDSPRPTTRVYFGYNYYDNVNASYNGDIGGSQLHRETIAFEYAFGGGDFSVGMRLPFFQNKAPLGLDQNNVGDLSILLKYAFYNDRESGDVASTGLIITTPTAGNGNLTLNDGSALVLIDGTTLPTDSVLFQPWLGGVKMLERGYVQGISGLLVSTSNREPLIFNNSVGAGYFLFQNPTDRFIKAVIPNMEVHVRTPLNNRDPNGAIFLQDQVNISTGVHFRTMRATVSPAINVPVVGPRPWNLEAMIWVNCTF